MGRSCVSFHYVDYAFNVLAGTEDYGVSDNVPDVVSIVGPGKELVTAVLDRTPGHNNLLLRDLVKFETFPVGTGALESVQRMRLHELGSVVFRYGLWIALPMIGMLLFVNIVLGFISRVAPQMNAFAIGFPITLTTGLLGIAVTLPMLEGPVLALLRLATGLFTGG